LAREVIRKTGRPDEKGCGLFDTKQTAFCEHYYEGKGQAYFSDPTIPTNVQPDMPLDGRKYLDLWRL
jgi:hypothetical protein